MVYINSIVNVKNWYIYIYHILAIKHGTEVLFLKDRHIYITQTPYDSCVLNLFLRNKKSLFIYNFCTQCSSYESACDP